MDGQDGMDRVETPPPLPFLCPSSEVGRALPDRRVTRETFQDAYASFILFCNPLYPEDSDIAMLKDVFLAPPTSNRKTFETFDIFLHVRKLYGNEVKTWQQIAIELGVEPGSADEAAGNQRVQQWLVRLKRWMKLSHVDAFFQYLVGKPHDYYLQVPSIHGGRSAEARDGVSLGEDLALRALDPSLRPRRGRKRQEMPMQDLPPAQRHTFTGGTPLSALPLSALPRSESAITDRLGHDPWSAMSPWPSHIGVSASTELHSAFSAFPVDPSADSMRTPAMATRLNKWAQNTSGSVGGPQSKPVSPAQKRRTTPPARTPSSLVGGHVLTALDTRVPPQKPGPDLPTSAVSTASTASKRERQRLQLQVPKHAGGPVRLMTPRAPPPAAGRVSAQAEQDVTAGGDAVYQVDDSTQAHLEALKRSLSADLLRADLVGRDSKLRGAEAKALATAILDKLGLGPDHDGSVETMITAAVQLGLAHSLILPGLAFPQIVTPKTLHVTRYVIDSDGYEMSVEEARLSRQTGVVKDVFDLEWSSAMGGMVGQLKIRGIDILAGNSEEAISQKEG